VSKYRKTGTSLWHQGAERVPFSSSDIENVRKSPSYGTFGTNRDISPAVRLPTEPKDSAGQLRLKMSEPVRRWDIRRLSANHTQPIRRKDNGLLFD